jgi:hypothetical protein
MLNLLKYIVKPAYAVCEAGDGGVELGECLRLNNDTAIRDVYDNPAFLINLIVRNLFVLAGIMLFFFLILAGYKFLTGGKKGVDEAKTIATNAILGFILMFSAYWIVQLINILFGVEIPL